MARPIGIALAGDIFLGEEPRFTLDGAVREVFRGADLVIANLESPITARERAVGGKGCLRSAPAAAERLRDWGVDVVSLANNHVFDHGWEGFEDTLRALDQAGIKYLGAGKKLAVATRPLILTIRGLRIGLLAYSWGFIQTRCATLDAYGCAPLDAELMAAQIRELVPAVDVVIVLPHWGYCDYRLPTPEQVVLADRLLEAGATAVVGSHSHVVQGVAERGGRLVAFSLGNFAFAPFVDRGQPSRLTRENREGLVLSLHLESGRVASFDTVFTHMQGDTVVTDNRPARREELERRSRPLRLPAYQRSWRKYVRRRMARRMLHYANVLNWRRIKKETLIGGWLLLRGALKGRR